MVLSGPAGMTAMDMNPTLGNMTWSSLVDSCQSYLPDGTKCTLRPEFYLAFWSLEYYDLHVPENRCAAARLRGRNGMALDP